jgi:hypothetical protein
MSTVHYDATSAHVTLANHITDATNTYLLAVEVCGEPAAHLPSHLPCDHVLTVCWIAPTPNTPQSYMKMKRPALASTLLLELATSLEVRMGMASLECEV